MQPRIATILCALVACVSSAKELHVSVQGNDSSDGSAARPLRTISAAARLAQPGDVVTVHAGTYRERVARLCVVDCPEDVQVARVMQRSGLDATQVRAIMAAQASRASRLAIADDVIVNDSSLAALEAAVRQLHDRYLILARPA